MSEYLRRFWVGFAHIGAPSMRLALGFLREYRFITSTSLFPRSTLRSRISSWA